MLKYRLGVMLWMATFIAPSTAGTTQKGAAVSVGYRLTASMEKKQFSTEEPVYVSVVFENISGRELPYGAQGRDFDYLLECHYAPAESAPLTLAPSTVYGQRLAANRGEGRYIKSSLPMGGQLVNPLNVSRICDLSMPGRYTVQVTREVFPQRNQGFPVLSTEVLAFEIFEP